MGVGFLVLLVALVPFASSRDLRTASSVNRRTSPDPLLVQLFNDPTATSQLTKQLLDSSDDDSASGSGLWAASGDESKSSDVKTAATATTTATVTKPEPVVLSNDAPVWDNSGSGSGAEDVTVETKDDNVKNVDENAKKSSFVPSQTQTVTDQVEEGNGVHDSTAAPKADANDMYDATIVKKNDVPKPDDVSATGKSVIVQTPSGGLQPLTPDPAAQPQDLSQMAMQPQQDMSQAAFQPPQMQQDVSQAALQPQQDMAQQYAMQPQQDMAQAQAQAQAQAPQQDAPAPQQDSAAAPQMMAPNMMNSTMYQGAPLQSDAQDYSQYQDQAQAAAYPQAGQGVDQADAQGQAAVNPYAADQYDQQQIDPRTGLQFSGLQQVPVFKGLKAKKVEIKEDECEDMYDSCPDMAKNNYCKDYSELMHTQCKKSCGFCKAKDESSASGSGLAVWDGPEEGDKVVGESSGSGSAPASDVWSSSASGENMLKGEAETGDVTDVVNDEEPEASAKKEDSTIETEVGSGSAQPSDDLESSGANLAEDLATGTVSRSEQEVKETDAPKAKYSEIPSAPKVIIQQEPAAEVYPHIDLKVIAKAVEAYKSTALRMLGEAIKDSAQEAENEATKRTNIPMPPANDLLKKMGFPMDQPQYGYPYAQYYQSPYAEAAAAARAKIAKAKADAEKKAKEEAEAAAAAKAKAEEEARKKKKDEEGSGGDPYEYIRDMPKGASMQPIESHPGASNVGHGHSNPIILFKNSQISNAEAAKKATIPRPEPAVSNFLMQQMPQAAAPRSGVTSASDNAMDGSQSNNYIQDSSMEMPSNSTEQFVSQTPEGDNQFMNNFAANSQAPFVQQQGAQDAELRSYFPGQKKKRSVKTKSH